jgi:hypothetical protein
VLPEVNCVPRGETRVKGFAQPVKVYAVDSAPTGFPRAMAVGEQRHQVPDIARVCEVVPSTQVPLDCWSDRINYLNPSMTLLNGESMTGLASRGLPSQKKDS